jgi:excisionase family DNA binding protein
MRVTNDATKSTRLLEMPEEAALTRGMRRMPSGASAHGHKHNGEREPLLLTVDEVAKMLRIGRTVAYQLMQKGEIHSVKIGRNRRVVASSIRDYVMRLRDETSGE